MPRWLRWTGRLLAGLLLLIVVAVAAVYVVSSLAIRKTYRFPDSAVRAATDSASLAWGRHLMEAVTKCQECHDGDLGGKMMIDDPAFARLATANLTGVVAALRSTPMPTSSAPSATAWGGTAAH